MHMPCFHAFYTLLKQFWFFCLKFSYSLLVGSFLPPIQKFTTLPSIFAYTMLQFSHPLPDGGFARSSATSWQPLLLNCSWWFRPRQLCIQSIQANARFMSDAIYILHCSALLQLERFMCDTYVMQNSCVMWYALIQCNVQYQRYIYSHMGQKGIAVMKYGWQKFYFIAMHHMLVLYFLMMAPLILISEYCVSLGTLYL